MTNSERVTPAELLQFLSAHANNPPYIPERDDEPEAPAPLSPEREQEIRETDPGDWYRAPWTTAFVNGNGEADDPSYWRVISEGETIATLPDFAEGLALFIADAREAVPELLAELGRVRAERDRAVRAFETLAEKHDKVKSERDELEKRVVDARMAAIEDVANWLASIGDEGAAYIVRTCDIPEAGDQ
ncbi:hypothetical protein [Streptomyces sparsogenes]|uniref:Uncharacterized protein n=1 Tax=Streptomyces sparsogenes DSM 40356 TaxID=1331668 RepID=A0A1R1S8G3_9ACTN|nr:hypothetical protein [Streptomyces sparsogenes]OMI34472.1 hypothetical protein SPAR_36851 [Streptomyces sparsogenes DSM 40356]